MDNNFTHFLIKVINEDFGVSPENIVKGYAGCKNAHLEFEKKFKGWPRLYQIASKKFLLRNKINPIVNPSALKEPLTYKELKVANLANDALFKISIRDAFPLYNASTEDLIDLIEILENNGFEIITKNK